MNEMWIITTGEYSDYRVVAGALDESTLNEFVEHLGSLAGDYRVESIPLLQPGEGPTVFRLYVANWHSDPRLRSSGEEIRRYDYAVIAELDPDTPPPSERPRVISETNRSGGVFLQATGTSEEAVVKALADRVAQYKAEQAGLTV